MEASDAGRLDLDAVIDQAKAGIAERETIMRLVSELLQAGEAVPLEIERQALIFHIEDDASRIDLKRRLVNVLRMLSLPVPSALLEEVRDSYIREEAETDFQQMMADYGAKVGLSDLEPAFLEDLAIVRRFTMTSVERLYALWDAVRYVAAATVPGHLVECGVWRGGSVMLMALALIRAKATDRTLWLYDTFTGLPRPDPELDVDVLGNRAIDGWQPRNIGGGKIYWALADEADVRANIAATEYPAAKLRFVRGQVERTIPAQVPDEIAILRIDTDWYASYRHILAHLYDRVVPGGVVIFDDYGHFLGARRAVDEFRAERSIVAPMVRVDFSCRLMLKI